MAEMSLLESNLLGQAGAAPRTPSSTCPCRLTVFASRRLALVGYDDGLVLGETTVHGVKSYAFGLSLRRRLPAGGGEQEVTSATFPPTTLDAPLTPALRNIPFN